jgi:DNA-binding Lrp family transcriptional regulator
VCFFLSMVDCVQVQTETINVINAVKDQVHKTLESSPELTEIDILLDNMAVYVKRAMGLPLNEADLRVPEHMHFNGLVGMPSQRLCDSLLRRLRVIQRFGISSPDKITRDLLYGLFARQAPPLTGEETRLLNILYKDPRVSPPRAAHELGVSVPTIRKMTRTLEDKVDLRFANYVDHRRFKLHHIGVFFATTGPEASREVERLLRNEMSTYMTTAVFDTTYQRGYAAFLIPSQTKPLALFHREVEALEEEYFESVQVHDYDARYLAISFDHFDFETGDWIIEGDVTTLGLLNFVRENWDMLARPQCLKLTEPRPFDKLDYYLATILEGDGRARMDTTLQRLAALGIRAPRTTVSTRKSILYQEGSLLPVIVFESPMLPVFVSFAIRCDAKLTEQLLVAAAQMPHTFASTSDIGCVLHVKIPMRSLGAILNLLSLVREEEGVEEVIQIQRYKNLGSAALSRLGSKWNGNYWEWDEKEFSIPSLGLE